MSLAVPGPGSLDSLVVVKELRPDVATEAWELPPATLRAGVGAALLEVMLRLLHTAKPAG